MLFDCTDSITLLSSVNSSLEKTLRDNIACCLENQCHALRKNVPSKSELLFGDNLSKRIMNVATKKKLLGTTSKPYNTPFEMSKNFG